MTFKTPVYEGDFSIRMPSMSEQPIEQMELLDETMTITLIADENRDLQAINVAYLADTFTYTVDPENPKAVFKALNDYVIAVVGNRSDPSAPDIEAQLDAAYDLKYHETIQTIEAVSGHRTPEGQIIQLIEKINFKNPA